MIVHIVSAHYDCEDHILGVYSNSEAASHHYDALLLESYRDEHANDANPSAEELEAWYETASEDGSWGLYCSEYEAETTYTPEPA
ncbi:hypothetical protein [Roseibium alexandrii]|uniref:hypothetical protein n=1 Tax=Roseibium alexandrii TaxID=388408 RepID=UPI003752A163